ncbi:hypothetical protein OsJ_08497 [Oryza sativa Japonica Group]|uniref:Uncharacterized protein n=1 Tax=Oryza sativa subsp. japonica TaxID=39947 RepID=B9F351_ORYSJ|nr:hypothetical protein OsJ_08497 [Oryza sativa Japonica Group]
MADLVVVRAGSGGAQLRRSSAAEARRPEATPSSRRRRPGTQVEAAVGRRLAAAARWQIEAVDPGLPPFSHSPAATTPSPFSQICARARWRLRRCSTAVEAGRAH